MSVTAHKAMIFLVLFNHSSFRSNHCWYRFVNVFQCRSVTRCCPPSSHDFRKLSQSAPDSDMINIAPWSRDCHIQRISLGCTPTSTAGNWHPPWAAETHELCRCHVWPTVSCRVARIEWIQFYIWVNILVNLVATSWGTRRIRKFNIFLAYKCWKCQWHLPEGERVAGVSQIETHSPCSLALSVWHRHKQLELYLVAQSCFLLSLDGWRVGTMPGWWQSQDSNSNSNPNSNNTSSGSNSNKSNSNTQHATCKGQKKL